MMGGDGGEGRFVMRRISLVLTIVLLATSGAAPASSGTRGAEPSRRWPVCGGWREVAPPHGGALGSVQGVAVISPYEAWVVTDYAVAGAHESHVYRWGGVRWSEVAFPTPRHLGDYPYWELRAIEAVGPNEVWAVGYRGSDPTHPISARWDGTRWRLIPIGIPNLRGSLDGLAVVPGTSELWAVGSAGDRLLALRWDGRAWHRTPTPRLGAYSMYTDVVTTSGGATWAVGVTLEGEGRMLLSRWTGHGWTLRPGPPGQLTGIDGLTADSLWAVGWNQPSGSGRSRGIIMRRDAHGWRVARRFDRVEGLNAIEVASPTDAWAVGEAFVQATRSSRPFILRRHGGRWRIDWAPDHIEGGLAAIGGTPHNLWTFLWPSGQLGSFVPYHRC